MVNVIVGSEKLKIDNLVSKLAKEFLGEVNEFNFLSLDSEKVSIQEIISDAISIPFGFDKKVVVVSNAFYFTSQKEPKLPFTNNYEVLEEFLKSSYPDALVIFTLVGELDNRKSLTKKLLEKARLFKLEDVDSNEAINFVKSYVSKNGGSISHNDADYLIKRAGLDLTKLAIECDKLLLYSLNINKEMIDELIAMPKEDNIFLLVDALINNDLKKLLKIFYDLVYLGEEETKIIMLLASQLRLQYQVNYLNSKRMSEALIAKELKIHPYRVKLFINKGRYLSNKDILFLLDKLAMLDLDIKSGKVDKFIGLELFFIKLVG